MLHNPYQKNLSSLTILDFTRLHLTFVQAFLSSRPAAVGMESTHSWGNLELFGVRLIDFTPQVVPSNKGRMRPGTLEPLGAKHWIFELVVSEGFEDEVARASW